MTPIHEVFLRRWHRMLGLRHQTASWYNERLAEEIQEANDAKTTLHRVSEKSDLLFAVIRAKYDGFPIQEIPKLDVKNAHLYAYMLGKYTSRWYFYNVAGQLCGQTDVREVINARKDEKLRIVARRHGIDPDEFVRVGRKLRRIWPLLP